MAEKKKTEGAATPAKKTATRRASTSRAKSAPPVAITYEMIAERAYHISQSEDGGSPDDNWLRAEAELLSV